MKSKDIIQKLLPIAALLMLAFPAADACALDEPASSAAAQTQEIAAVYAAVATPPDENEALTTTVRYVFEDGTYKQYIFQNDRYEMDSQGQEAFPGETDFGFVRIYPQQESLPTPVPESGGRADLPVDDSAQAYIDEGVDTRIRITGYTKYSGNPADYFLSAGDRIAVISPSALPGEEQTQATVEGLRSWGFEPVMGRYVCAEVRTLEECREDFQWALEDPQIKAVFCVRGGYGVTELLDTLAGDLIGKACKPIIGYSDITACHGAWTIAGLPSIHASMSAAFGDSPEECIRAEQRMMTGELPVYAFEADAFNRAGTAEGILIGGNLSTFTATLDTSYDSTKPDQPYILFLEETGENMQHIHRYLTILKNRGILDGAAGIVFGEWTELPADGMGNYGKARGGLFDSVADMISRQFLDGLNVPVAFGFPAGHGLNNYPLLMGAGARLDVSGEYCTLSWPQAAGE